MPNARRRGPAPCQPRMQPSHERARLPVWMQLRRGVHRHVRGAGGGAQTSPCCGKAVGTEPCGCWVTPRRRSEPPQPVAYSENAHPLKEAVVLGHQASESNPTERQVMRSGAFGLPVTPPGRAGLVAVRREERAAFGSGTETRVPVPMLTGSAQSVPRLPLSRFARRTLGTDGVSGRAPPRAPLLSQRCPCATRFEMLSVASVSW